MAKIEVDTDVLAKYMKARTALEQAKKDLEATRGQIPKELLTTLEPQPAPSNGDSVTAAQVHAPLSTDHMTTAGQSMLKFLASDDHKSKGAKFMTIKKHINELKLGFDVNGKHIDDIAKADEFKDFILIDEKTRPKTYKITSKGNAFVKQLA